MGIIARSGAGEPDSEGHDRRGMPYVRQRWRDSQRTGIRNKIKFTTYGHKISSHIKTMSTPFLGGAIVIPARATALFDKPPFYGAEYSKCPMCIFLAHFVHTDKQ